MGEESAVLLWSFFWKKAVAPKGRPCVCVNTSSEGVNRFGLNPFNTVVLAVLNHCCVNRWLLWLLHTLSLEVCFRALLSFQTNLVLLCLILFIFLPFFFKYLRSPFIYGPALLILSGVRNVLRVQNVHYIPKALKTKMKVTSWDTTCSFLMINTLALSHKKVCSNRMVLFDIQHLCPWSYDDCILLNFFHCIMKRYIGIPALIRLYTSQKYF